MPLTKVKGSVAPTGSGGVDPSVLELPGLTKANKLVEGFVSTGVTDGAWVHLAGYRSVGDGGGGWFRFSSTSTQPANGGTVIAPTGGGRLLRDGWTVLGFKGPVNVRWFGAAGDLSRDDTYFCQQAYEQVRSTGGTVLFPKGSYLLTKWVGNNPEDVNDWGDNITFQGESGTKVVFQTTWSGYGLSLCGNNVKVIDIEVTSQRTIDWHAESAPQQTPYQNGIFVGGKANQGTLAAYKTGAEVRGCKVTNMNTPIIVAQTGEFSVLDNEVSDYTATGIFLINTTVHGWITGNTVVRGIDDCFFAQNIPGNAWAAAGRFQGRYVISNNHFAETFGKCGGIGGYGMCLVTNNYFGLNWAGAFNLESDDWAQNNQLSYTGNVISYNIIENAGRNFHLSEPVVLHQSAFPGLAGSGVQTFYGNNRGGSCVYTNTSITDNKIINPYSCGVAIHSLDITSIERNEFTAGFYEHGSGQVATQGVPVAIDNCFQVTVKGNTTHTGPSINFTHAYNFTDATSTDVQIMWNEERYQTALFTGNTTAIAAARYWGREFTHGPLVSRNTSDDNLATGGLKSINTVGDTWTAITVSAGSQSFLYMNYNGADKGHFSSTTGGYTGLSDRTMKKNIEPSRYGLSDVLKLSPVMYHMQDEGDNTSKHIGLIAQDVQDVVPETVYQVGEKLGLCKDELIPVLIKAIQEMNEKIDKLK